MYHIRNKCLLLVKRAARRFSQNENVSRAICPTHPALDKTLYIQGEKKFKHKMIYSLAF